MAPSLGIEYHSAGRAERVDAGALGHRTLMSVDAHTAVHHQRGFILRGDAGSGLSDPSRH